LTLRFKIQLTVSVALSMAVVKLRKELIKIILVGNPVVLTTQTTERKIDVTKKTTQNRVAQREKKKIVMVSNLVVYSSAQTQFVVLGFNLNVFCRPLFTPAKTLSCKQTRKNVSTH